MTRTSGSRAQAKQIERWERERRGGDAPSAKGNGGGASVLVFNATAEEVQRRLGGAAGMYFCPGHGESAGKASKPSLAVRRSPDVAGAVSCTCFAICTREQLAAALEARGFRTKRNAGTTTAVRERLASPTPEENEVEKYDSWAVGKRLLAVETESKPTKYLASRGINICPNTLRLIERASVVKEITGNKPFPAMVAPVIASSTAYEKPNKGGISFGRQVEIAPDVVCAHVTFLQRPNTDAKIAGEARCFYGSKRGGYLPLPLTGNNIPQSATVVVAEGIETTLSLMQALGLPGYAVLDAGNMRKAELPPHAGYIIGADNDGETGGGVVAARRLAGRCKAPARVVVPPLLKGRRKTDFNDLLQTTAGEAAIRTLVKVAPLYGAGAEEQAATPTPGMDDEARADIARLAELPRGVEYAQVRNALAKRLSVSKGDIDAEVKQLRDAQERTELQKSPWLVNQPPAEEEVDGANLLDQIHDVIRDHVVMSKSALVTATLWVAFTHSVDAFANNPYLRIFSPVKECGKTSLMKVLRRLVPRPIPAGNMTGATIFWAIETYRPTIMLDEIDTYLKAREELRGILDSAHEKEFAFVGRRAGENYEGIKMYSTWAPLALSGIGKLHPTIESRSLLIELQRKPPSRTVKDPPKDPQQYLDLHRMLVRWTEDNFQDLRLAEPTVPKRIRNRSRDNWVPLLAIADLAGGDWPQLARQAAIRLSSKQQLDDDDFRAVLLADLRELFDREDADRLDSAWIVTQLNEREDRPWAEFKGAKKGLTVQALAALLKPFGITPKRGKGRGAAMGYEYTAFVPVWEKYL